MLVGGGYDLVAVVLEAHVAPQGLVVAQAVKETSGGRQRADVPGRAHVPEHQRDDLVG